MDPDEYVKKQERVSKGKRRASDVKPNKREVTARQVRSVACPKCKAKPRQFCRKYMDPQNAEPADREHKERIEAFKIAEKRIKP
jgi:hypothetical protein